MSDTQGTGPRITIQRVLASPAVAAVQISGAQWPWPYEDRDRPAAPRAPRRRK